MEFQEVFVCLLVFLSQYFGKTVGLENVLFTFTFLWPDRENFGEGGLWVHVFRQFQSNMPQKGAGRLRGRHQSVRETVHITEARKQRRRPEAGGGQTLQRPALNLLPPSVPPEDFLGFTRRKAVKTWAYRAFWSHIRVLSPGLWVIIQWVVLCGSCGLINMCSLSQTFSVE